MGVNTISTLLLFASVLVASAVAGPLSDRRGGQCARQCTEENKFNYEPGTTYTYSYEASTTTKMRHGTTRDESRLHLKANVDIEVVSKCEFSMKLRGVTLEQSDPRNPNAKIRSPGYQAFQQQLERHVIRFSYQDGRIEDVCAPDEEEPFVLNIKRGILSAFQTSMHNLDVAERVIETDVAGRCTAEYESLGRSWNSLSIRRTKDLTTCTDRESAKTVLQATPYTENKVTKSQPLMKGDQICTQMFRHERLYTSECTENHVFRPFSRQRSGAVTIATSKLTFQSQNKGRLAGAEYFPTRTGMLFQHEEAIHTEAQRKREVEMVLNELCSATSFDIRPQVPSLFARLVYKMREVDYAALLNIFQRVDSMCADNKMIRKFFLDALPIVGTSDSVKLMKEMIMRKIVSGSEADSYLSAIAFIPKPNVEMIATLTPLLDGNFPEALLHVSTMIHTFCHTHGDCGSVPEVQDAVRQIGIILGENCYGRERRIVILALKALGNIGLDFGISSNLQRCYSNPQIDTEIRLTAIQAFRRFSCNVPRDHFLMTYSNYNENTELRIAAYLAVMRCPSTIALKRIQEVMEREPINQVGAYVLSHLMNQENLITPFKKEIKSIVTDLYLLNKFHTDIRKFSHNFHKSFFMKSMDSGADLEADLIYTPESFLPRSAMFNLTFDLFGNSVNLFEIGGRFEGFEYYLESMFGPSGYLADTSIYKMLREVRKKRSIADNKIEDIEEKFNAKSRFPDTPSGSVYLKLFGNEMFYDTFKGLDIFDTNIKRMSIIEAFLKMLHEKDVEYTKSMMFLDATYTVPLGTGLPLRLAVNGTATVHLSASGKFEIRSLHDVDIKGKIKPSGAVEISSLMTVDARVASTGIKMVATLHSSTHLEGLVEIKNGEMARLQINVPKEKMEIIDIQSKIFLVHGGEEHEQKDVSAHEQQMSMCTGEYTSHMFGMELCNDLIVPTLRRDSPLFPMNGPAMFRVYLRKTDRTLTTYNLDASLTNDKLGRNKFLRRAMVSFNTPQSTIDREITLEANLNELDKSVSVKLRTPIKRFGMNAKFNNEKNKKRFDLSFTMDDREQFSMQSELAMQFTNGGSRFEPFLEVRIPSRRLVYMKGYATIRDGQKYIGQLSIEDITEKPIILAANIELKDKDRCEADFSMSSHMLDTNIKGFLQTGKNLASKMTLEYRFLDNPQEKFDFTAKFRDLSANSLFKYTGSISLQSTVLPEYSTAMNFEIQKTKGYWEKSLQINMGDGVRSRIHTINILEIVNYQFFPDRGNLLFTISMKYPQKNIDYALTYKHEHATTSGVVSFNDRMNVVYGPGKEFLTSLEGGLETSSKLMAKGDFKMQYPGREVILSGKAEKTEGENYEATLTCQLQRGKAMKILAKLNNKSDRNQINHEVNVEVMLPKRKPIKLAGSVLGTQQLYSAVGSMDMDKGKYEISCEYNKLSALDHRVFGKLALPRETYSMDMSMQGTRESITGNMNLKLGSRKEIAAKTEFMKLSDGGRASIDVMLDAAQDKTKRYLIEANYKTLQQGLQGGFMYKCPENEIKSSFNINTQGKLFSRLFRTNVRAELEFDPTHKFSVEFTTNANLQQSRRQLRSELTVKTPFRGYESNLLSFIHSDDGKNFNCQLTLPCSRNRKIILAADGNIMIQPNGQFFQGNLRMNTPFHGFESVRLDVGHERGPSDFSNKVDFQYATGKIISAGIYGSSYGAEGFRAGFNFSSPFEVQDFNAATSFSFRGNDIKAHAEVAYNNQKQLTVEFTGHHELSGQKRTCTTELLLTTSVSGFERITSKIDYVNDGRELSLTGDLYCNNKAIITSLTGTKNLSGKRKDLNGRFLLQTPFREFQRMLITVNHFNNRDRMQNSFDIEINDQKKVSLTTKGNMKSIDDIQGSFTLRTAFENFQELSADFTHKIDSNSIKTRAQFSAGVKKITMELNKASSVGYNTRNFNVNLLITTPFREYEEMRMNIDHDRKEDTVITRGELSKNAQKITIVQTSKFNTNSPMSNFEHALEIITPFESFQYGRLSASQTLAGNNFRHYVETEYNRKITRFSIIASKENSRSGDNLSATIELNTPFQQLKTFKIRGTHYANGGEFRDIVNIKFNRENAQLETYLEGRNVYTPEFKATFTSTFPSYDRVNFAAKYNIGHPRKTAEVSYLFGTDESKEYSIKAYCEMTPQVGEIKIDINAPVKQMMKSIFLRFNNQNQVKEMLLEIETTNSKSSILGEITSPQPSSYEGKVTIQTPFDGFEKMFGSIALGAKADAVYTGISLEKNNDRIQGRLECQIKDKIEARGTFKSTLRNFGDLDVQGSLDLKNPKKMVNILYMYNGVRMMEFNFDIHLESGDFLNINMDLFSPIRGFEDIKMTTRLNKGQSKLDVLFKLQLNPANIILATGNMNYDGTSFRSVDFNLNTPYSPLTTVKFTGSIVPQKEQLEVNGELALENSQNYKVNLILKKQSVRTANSRNDPQIVDFFKNRNLAVHDNENSPYFTGKLNVETPFRGMEQMQVSGVFMYGNGYGFEVNMESPTHKLAITNSFSSFKTNPVVFEFSVDAPFSSFQTFTIMANLQRKEFALEGGIIAATSRTKHTISGSYSNENRNMQGELRIESPILPSRRISFRLEFISDFTATMTGSMSMETPQSMHRFSFELMQNRREKRGEFTMDSPVLHNGQVKLTARFNNRLPNKFDAELSTVAFAETHAFKISLADTDKQAVMQVNIQCPFLSSRPIKIEGKYISTDDRAREAVITYIGTSTHTAKITLSSYDNEVRIQMAIESPLLNFRSLSISGNYKNVNLETMEGVLSITTPSQELRLAGNMRRKGLDEFDGFITLNTPFKSFRMARVDAKFSNNNNQMFDASMNIETSMQSFQAMSAVAKLRRNRALDDMSINMKMPFGKYRDVSLLTTIHYNRNSISPKVTLTTNGERFSLFGNYRHLPSDFFISAGCETNRGSKYEIEAQAKYPSNSIEARLQLITPIRRHEKYLASFNYNNDRRRITCQAMLENAFDKITVEGNFGYSNFPNFDTKVEVATPFTGFESFYAFVRQQSARNHYRLDAELTMPNRNKMVLNIKNGFNRTHQEGQFIFNTPFQMVRELKATYGYGQDSYNADANVDLSYNGQMLFRTEANYAYKSGNSYDKTLRLDIPVFPLTIMYDYQATQSGGDIRVKTIFPSRTSAFHVNLHTTENLFSHGMEFIFDERTKTVTSYEMRLSKGVQSGNQVNELFGRLNFPVRSFELKGLHTSLRNGREIIMDFFYDAAKDMSKHVKLTFGHNIFSTRRDTTHKVEFTANHPRLTKPITCRGELSFSRNEIIMKSQMEYSPDQRHHFLFEGRLKNAAPQSYFLDVTLRHPASNLETSLNGELINNRNLASVGLRLDHLDRHRRHRISELKAKIAKVKQEIELLMKAGENAFTLSGQLFNRDQQFAFVMEHRLNEGYLVHSHLRIDKENNNMDLNITTSRESGLHLRAAFPSDAYAIQMMHVQNGERHTDASITIGLIKSRLIRTKIDIRPETLNEFQDIVSQNYRAMRISFNEAINSAAEEIDEEANIKAMLISKSTSENTGPFMYDVQREMNLLQDDYNSAKTTIHRMYRRNELYMKDITERAAYAVHLTSDALGFMFEAIGDGMTACSNFVNHCCTYVSEAYDTMIGRMAEIYQNTLHNIKITMARMKIALARFVEQVFVGILQKTVDILNAVFIEFPHRCLVFIRVNMPFLEAGYKYFADARDVVIGQIADYIRNTMDAAYENAYIQLILDYLEEIRNTIVEFQKEITMTQMQEKFHTLYNSIPDAATITDPIIYYYDSVRAHPNVQYIGGLSRQIYDQSIRAYFYLGLDTIFEDLMHISYKSFQEAVLGFLHQVTKEYTSLANGIRYEVNMNQGSMLLEIPLPSERNTLYEAFDIMEYPAVKNFMRAARAKYIWHDEFSIYDGIYAFKNHLRKYHPFYWIPPFDARAMIAGKQHFKTFDDFYFEFAGECSYLLAHDFVDRNFSLAINYARDGRELVKKSLTIMSDGHQIEVSPDYKVSVDNTRRELPLAIGKTTVKREEGTILVNNDNGFEVQCNFIHDVCTVDMSGFYFAKTAGLFGTYDYEPKLDMMTPERTLAKGVTEFANSFEIGTPVCRRNRNFAETRGNSIRAEEKCRSLFKKYDSLFRPCFKQVSTEPFMTMCLNDLSAVSDSKYDEIICTSAFAYRSQCSSMGVSLRMPKSCVRCEKHDGSIMYEGDMITVTNTDSVQAADIVYIVEEKACNSETTRMLSRLARGIEDNFQSSAINSIRHAVVGFGGSGVHANPHVHTADGQIFGGIRFVDSAFNSLTTGDGPNNILEALRYAAALPFRAGASRTFVLLKCSACQAEELKADYSEVLRTLLDGDITLHILMDTEFTVKTKKQSAAKQVFGLDKQYAYTAKYLKDFRGDPDLRLQMRVPKDFCVPLALEVNGTFFSANKLTDTRRNTNKRFIDIFGQRMTQNAGPSECQICECIATDEGVGKSACQRCVSRVISQIYSPDFQVSDSFDTSLEIDDEMVSARSMKPLRRPQTRKLKLHRRE